MNHEEAYDFKESLAMSHKAEDLPFWEETYRRAFPGMVAMVNHRPNGWHQAAGIDRSIILENSKQILVDEKVRGKNRKTGKVYTDIALEYLSNDRTSAPGWVCKSLQSDYIAYAIAPLGRCYFLPVLQLQAAWKKNGEKWKEQYGTRYAKNKGYNTWFCPVPPKVVFPAIGFELRVTFEPCEYEED